MTEVDKIPQKLQEIVDDFRGADRREKLEMLLDYSQTLPPLPDNWKGLEMELDTVPECMTPVSVAAEVVNGGMIFHFVVPEESPTVRGFAAIISQGLQGVSPEEVLQLPIDFYQGMDLQTVLTPQRMSGMRAITAHVKRLALREMAS